MSAENREGRPLGEGPAENVSTVAAETETSVQGYTPPNGLGHVDLAPGDDGLIYPCLDCIRWHAQIITDDSGIFVREWHAADCPRVTDDGWSG